jgi:hypothetical protein
MPNAFDQEDSLTPEEIQQRFKKVFGREMNPEEKRYFFLAPQHPTDALPENT